MEGPISTSLFSPLIRPGGSFYHLGDFSGLGNKTVTRLNLFRLSTDSFRHESLQVGVDRMVWLAITSYPSA
jgi:hypothetical protein